MAGLLNSDQKFIFILIVAGMKFVYVVDNIDWEERVHDMREHHQNKSVHAVATSMVFNRISSEHLPDDGPQMDVKSCNFRDSSGQ